MKQRLRITVLAFRDPNDGEVDPVVERVARALHTNGHTVKVLTTTDDVRRLTKEIEKSRPDLIFNLLEEFGDRSIGCDVAAVGLLDLVGVPYTGGGPGEFYLAGDKHLTKKLLAFERIHFPEFSVVPRGGEFRPTTRLEMPLFVKPVRLDGSIGIESGAQAVVRNESDLKKRVCEIHQRHEDDALIEEYIEGRELYLGIIGNESPIVFPPIEMDFSGLPHGAPKVMDAKAKFDASSPEYHGTKAKIAELPEELTAHVKNIALAAYRALRVRDYGRVDLRLDEHGQAFVLEVNPSCYLDERGEFVMGARAAGLTYDALIDRIVQEARARAEATGKIAPRSLSRTA